MARRIFPHHLMKTTFFLLVLLMLSWQSYAQNAKIDSLKHLLQTKISPQKRVDVYNDLSYAYHYRNHQKALQYAQKALKMTKDIKYRKGLADAYNNFGLHNETISNFVKAQYYYQQALNIYREVKHYRGVGLSKNNLAYLLQNKSKYPEALKMYQEALQIMKKHGTDSDISMVFNNIGNIHYYLKEYSKAQEYYKKCLKIDLAQKDSSAIANSLGNIALTYGHSGQEQKALQNTEQAIRISRAIKDSAQLIYSLNNISIRYRKLHKFEQAQTALVEALTISQILRDRYGQAMIHNTFANLYLEQSQLEQAIRHGIASREIAQEINTYTLQSSACKLLAEAHAKLGQYKKAYEAKICFEVCNDSILNQQKFESIKALELAQQEALNHKLTKEKALKDLQIKQQAQTLRSRWVLMLLTTLILILLSGLLYLLYRSHQFHKNTNKILQKKVKERTLNLEQAYQRIREVSFANSHHTRRPLANILGLLNLLEEDKISDPEVLEVLSLLRESANELEEVLLEINEELAKT